MVRTRLIFGFTAFVILVISAWAKNWFPGISVEILALAAVNVLGYIFGETLRPSGGKQWRGGQEKK